MGLYDKPESFKRRHWFWILGLGLIYAVYTALSWSVGYIDFGDGNYMYIGWRIAQGAVVYRDILAPQPPCHLFLGAGIVKLGQFLASLPGVGEAFRSPLATLYLFRGFSLLLHLATYALVLRLAWRAWGRPATTVVAGAIWLWLPINFWWSLGYQSEPLEIFFLLAMMAAALRVTFFGDLLAGVFAALAALTNATAAPFLLVLIIYMLLRAPLRALRMTAPCVLLAGAVVFVMQRWTEGAFWQNVFANQVGSFPNKSVSDFLHYAIGKLVGQGGGVMLQEGAFVILALIGLWRYLATSPLDAVSCAGLGWFFVATLGSITYVVKGGTEDYIFNLAEPAVAILAAGELVAWGRRWKSPLPERRPGWMLRNIPFWPLKFAATFLLAAFALGRGISFHYEMRTQQAYELPAERTVTIVMRDPVTGQVLRDPVTGEAQEREFTIEPVDRIVHMIEKYSKPGERILAPPYYAFLARRPIWGDYSELFLWQMKYKNDVEAKKPEGEGWRKVRAMAAAIQGQQLPFIIMDMDQPGMLPEVMTALRQAYVPLNSPVVIPGEPAGYLVATRNTRIGFFAPLGVATPERLAAQRERWLAFQLDVLHYYGLEGVRKFAAWYDFNAVLRALAPPAPAPSAPQPAPTPTPAPTPAPAKAAPIKPILHPHAEPTSATLGGHAPQAQEGPTTRTLNQQPAIPAAPTSPTLGGGQPPHPALPAPRPAPAPTSTPPPTPQPPAEAQITSAGQAVQGFTTPTSPTLARRRAKSRAKEEIHQFEQR